MIRILQISFVFFVRVMQYLTSIMIKYLINNNLIMKLLKLYELTNHNYA